MLRLTDSPKATIIGVICSRLEEIYERESEIVRDLAGFLSSPGFGSFTLKSQHDRVFDAEISMHSRRKSSKNGVT